MPNTNKSICKSPLHTVHYNLHESTEPTHQDFLKQIKEVTRQKIEPLLYCVGETFHVVQLPLTHRQANLNAAAGGSYASKDCC